MLVSQLVRIRPPQLMMSQREFQGGATYGQSRKEYVAVADLNPREPITAASGMGPQPL